MNDLIPVISHLGSEAISTCRLSTWLDTLPVFGLSPFMGLIGLGGIWVFKNTN